MEEKERYGITDGHYLCDIAIFNTETNDILGLYQICDLLNQQDKENQQLKQQLHDLPKKIVEEIRIAIFEGCREYFNAEDDGVIQYTEITPKKCNKILDAILKKYGGEDESE